MVDVIARPSDIPPPSQQQQKQQQESVTLVADNVKQEDTNNIPVETKENNNKVEKCQKVGETGNRPKFTGNEIKPPKIYVLHAPLILATRSNRLNLLNTFLQQIFNVRPPDFALYLRSNTFAIYLVRTV